LKRPTFLEVRYGPIEAQMIADSWTPYLLHQMVSAVWDGYDYLREEFLSSVDMSQDFEDLERELSELLCYCIRRRMDASMVVDIVHAAAEREKRAPAPAKPPTYDFAFVLHANLLLRWPLEAKVLKSDKNTKTNLGDYVETFNTRFLTCNYAPFSPSGAMVAYLKSGDANTALDHVALRLPCVMTAYADLPTRVHRTSDHTREVESGKPYPTQFRCHHLVMPLY